MRTSVLLWVTASVIASGSQEKTYDLKFDAKPVKGHKSEQFLKTATRLAMKVNGQPAGGMTEDKVFAAIQEILAVDADDRTKRRWVFSKASRQVEGKALSFGFEGRTVIMTDAKGKAREFTLEGGGSFSEQDLKGLKEAFDEAKEEGKPSITDLLAPPKSVKVGESWTVDVKKGGAVVDKKMMEAIDPAKSRIIYTLKSVETRSGVEFGKIAGTMELVLTAFGPLKLDLPLTVNIVVEVESCIDGKLPDGVSRVKAELKGKSPATTDSGKIEIEVDLTMDRERVITSTK